MPYLVIKFDSDAYLEDFMTWLDCQGEQSYFIYNDVNFVEQPRVSYDYDEKFITITCKKESEAHA